MALSSVSEKRCHSINILNGVPVVPMSLKSKESKSLLAKLKDGALDRVFSLHRMIMLLYSPSVLAGTSGTLTMKLLNIDSGETILITSDHPVSQAATFVCRWPRAVLAQAAGLALLIAVDSVDTKRGSLVGVLTPFWEDKMSTKMVYERELPALMYPLEEQEPAFYVKDLKRLRSVISSRILLGGSGSDIAPQVVTLSLPPRTPKVARPSPMSEVPVAPPALSEAGTPPAAPSRNRAASYKVPALRSE